MFWKFIIWLQFSVIGRCPFIWAYSLIWVFLLIVSLWKQYNSMCILEEDMICVSKNKILQFFYQTVCRYNYIDALVHQTVIVQPKSVSDMKTLCLKCMKINIYSVIIKIWPNLDVYKNHMIYQYAKVEQNINVRCKWFCCKVINFALIYNTVSNDNGRFYDNERK